jgi:hypothetical protein
MAAIKGAHSKNKPEGFINLLILPQSDRFRICVWRPSCLCPIPTRFGFIFMKSLFLFDILDMIHGCDVFVLIEDISDDETADSSCR